MTAESPGPTDPSATDLAFEPFATADGTGIEVIDPIERHRYTLQTPTAVVPEPADASGFRFPIDAAVAVRTAAITLPNVPLVHVRDDAGRELAVVEQFDCETFPTGSYVIELHTPIKLFVRVEGSLTVEAGAERTVFEFGDPARVTVGARSYHRSPATTVTTTDDPADVMAAVSTFGSAVKTTSPERSFPTLRGHPPAIELGDELAVPDGVAPPDTGVTIELPAEYRFVYPTAPLSYYLGAPLMPGTTPRLRTDDGFEHALAPSSAAGRGFEREVERVLKQVFFLDCLTRTEGLYPVDLHERDALEADLDLDFAGLYDATSAERLAAYLDVPFSVIEGHLPDWKLTTHVAAAPSSVETLPFVVGDLSVVTIPDSDDRAPVSPMEACAFDEIGPATRTDGDGSTPLVRGGGARSADAQSEASGASAGAIADEEFVKPTPTDSKEQVWIGDGTPIGASKATTAAYHNRLDRTPNHGDVEITVVCNEGGMDDEEDVVDDIYGSREALPFDVTVRRELTRADLRDVLAAEHDFLHYIGHIDAGGFDCADGQLDATSLDTVGVDAFLLNACHSYEQGMALIEAGAIGGIVTLNELLNHGAIRMGRTLARLLNCGFPLRSAVEIARDESLVGEQYLVVGDGGIAVAQAESNNPNLRKIERVGDLFQVEYHTYPTSELGLGGMVSPYLTSDNERFLTSGSTRTFEVSQEKLKQFLDLEDMPIEIDGRIRWNNQIDLNEL